MHYASDIAFTATVKAIQARKGSRRAYGHMEQAGSWQTAITAELKAFVEAQRSVFLATVNRDGQPYIQHRGGPPGFLRVLDEHTLAFVDFSGNRQFISTGNLQENPKAHLFLIDYRQRKRVKIWGEAHMVATTADLLAQLMPPGYQARPEQVLRFTVKAWDANCPQHIPPRFEAEDVLAALQDKDTRIAELEAELARFRAAAK
ncbi:MULTISPECIES: pyridoxamine 5'-phosphate oxidase family protein [unclassified Lysobacter]|uniref:pyridoxamine 5'-phosphate oxidase family protein n=1 Tax=unclassified Lysobacter TaxID=2635362 RepID=UPI001BED1D64|nr:MULTISPECIES: pyridoxamine 5'-phosphate oxidase family protein [unclassified Lysobacter]MBT2746737.1 pyridoxamine 5'-phosphate oxidase family protein [Lysobacter sp. ISL-42]MBT2751786.1 pyridoxamine 5'-phosphate oxidase family protein [Lysobacter sp. ISL-50]MBT2778138.1 pyridoxamine 5'-phosphate oxidase family protein [Lysobacter sp. ISL-54]MBT2781779.1 pyridoxamine 5'-phosphate oxidase family protein [Lysobacter sp. ISL-52]